MSETQGTSKVMRYGPATAERPSYVDTFENNRWVRTFDDERYVEHFDKERLINEKQSDNITIPLKEKIVKNLDLYKKETKIKLAKVISDKSSTVKTMSVLSLLRALLYISMMLVYLNSLLIDPLAFECQLLRANTKYQCVKIKYVIDGVNVSMKNSTSMTVADVPIHDGVRVYNSSKYHIGSLFPMDVEEERIMALVYKVQSGIHGQKMNILFVSAISLLCVVIFDKYFQLKMEIYEDREKEFKKILDMKTDEDRRVEGLFSSFKEYLARKPQSS